MRRIFTIALFFSVGACNSSQPVSAPIASTDAASVAPATSASVAKLPASASASASASAVAAPPPLDPNLVIDEEGARAQQGKDVGVRGTAGNAKIGAMLHANGLVVYCLGTTKWPNDLAGKPVVAHGRLERSFDYESQTTSSGLPTQGTSGGVWVLKGCKFDR